MLDVLNLKDVERTLEQFKPLMYVYFKPVTYL